MVGPPGHLCVCLHVHVRVCGAGVLSVLDVLQDWGWCAALHGHSHKALGAAVNLPFSAPFIFSLPLSFPFSLPVSLSPFLLPFLPPFLPPSLPPFHPPPFFMLVSNELRLFLTQPTLSPPPSSLLPPSCLYFIPGVATLWPVIPASLRLGTDNT